MQIQNTQIVLRFTWLCIWSRLEYKLGGHKRRFIEKAESENKKMDHNFHNQMQLIYRVSGNRSIKGVNDV